MVRKITLPEAPPVITGSSSLENGNRQSVVANNPAVQESPKIPPPVSRWAPGGNNHADRPCPNGAIEEDKHQFEDVKSHTTNVLGAAAKIKPTTPVNAPPDSNKGIVLILACLIVFGFVCFLSINLKSTDPSNVTAASNVNTTDSLDDHGIGGALGKASVASTVEIANPSPPSDSRSDATFLADKKSDFTPHLPTKAAPPKSATPKFITPKTESKKTGLQDWLKLAEEGDLQAQSQVGHMYSTGEGTKKDYEEAFRWNLIAAKRGSSRAQSNLGVSYGMGNGVERDNIEACAWWHIAARSGNTSARNNLKKYDSFFTDEQKQQAIERAAVLSRQIGD
jgi:hypothetical protein